MVFGLACLYLLVDAPRGAWLCYLAGAVYVGVFSWSLRHVVFAAWFGIAVVGGLYFAVLPAWVRGLRGLRCPTALAFGAAVAGSAWLRAHMPEIGYPHAQPAHALYRWPALLAGPATFGGEALVNFFLASASAALADLRRAARRRHGAAVLVGVALAWSLLAWARVPVTTERAVTIAAAQPGPIPWQSRGALAAWQRDSLLAPTLAVAGPGAAAPVDLVLWPESASFADVAPAEEERGPRLVADPEWLVDWPLPLADGVRLLLGGRVASGPNQGIAAAVLVDARGRLLGYHEKVRLVPGGERQPFLGWLPRSVSDALQGSLQAALGAAPHLVAGQLRPPLPVADGVAAGSLLCYDNAFPEVARAYVEAGANLLVVLSNEMWYRGGWELDQMQAMTVLRALETRAPVVRCTIDGLTLVVDPDGRVPAHLPRGAGMLTARVAVPTTAGPVAPAAPVVAATAVLSSLLALAHGLVAWARLRRPVRESKPPDAAGSSPVVGS